MQPEQLDVASESQATTPDPESLPNGEQGRGSTISRHQSRLEALGHRLHLVGSVDEYLRVTDQLGAEVVFVAENFDGGARQSVAHWVRHATPNARVLFLYEHHVDDAAHPGRFVNVTVAREVVNALPTEHKRRQFGA